MFSQIIALVFAALIAPAAATACVRTYTVVDGDFCDAISAAQNVSTYQLYVNNIASVNAECSNLAINQTLCLGTTGADCNTTYVVKTDDTCDSIIQSTGVNSTILNHNNPQITDACDNIYTGEVLCVAKSALVPAAPTGSSAPVPTSPATTASPKPTASSASPKPTATGSSGNSGNLGNGNSGDDDNLPYCDEL
ncbi:carbohydrate-binding module family 50 protein [Athelia psychrophila]|uniref:Carbohydrate-binding module family 50 protein n=1 Tax=Athelia psychrophila TaxID=1759441 RepID=A0A165Y459_9AGAM|nr:carbohydrate-binding module family 50 protein [Fibularhizoctonia sp. CBS 109695]KZP27677.1 carbohydrate-binding module family 50 protein [Fibularhizoctonia sp. CBS 109695]